MRTYLMTLATLLGLSSHASQTQQRANNTDTSYTTEHYYITSNTTVDELVKKKNFGPKTTLNKGNITLKPSNLLLTNKNGATARFVKMIDAIDVDASGAITTKKLKDTIKKVTITGRVLDARTKEPLTGATIGTVDRGGITQADIKGNYKITVAEGSTLTFAFVSYAHQTHKLQPGEQVVNINMSADTKTVNDVVIRGYVKRDRTKINGKEYAIQGIEIQDHPIANVEQLLQGKVAGTAVYGNAGAPGMRGSVNIRGLSTPAPLREVAVKAAPNYAYIRPTAPGNEDYGRINENQFTNPLNTPLSTFAIDVDKASYANVRRFINAGQLPPKDAVRIEELINYFNYNLPEPTNGDPVAIQTEIATAPWNTKHQLVRIGLRAKDVKTDKLPASNLVFLIDVSGSMNAVNKLPLVKTSLKMLVDQLRPNDKVAIVTYAGYVGTALESTPASEKDKIKEAIDRLGAGGGTAGGAGLMMAYQVAQKGFIKKGNNRIIMATDGDFNVGASSNQEMEDLIAEERKSGISLSVLGFGMGNYKDSKMELLADKGHGNYAYIDNITEATKSMVTEFGGTLFTVAKDVKIQVEFNPNTVQAYRLLGYENRLMAKEDFNNDSKLGGDMGVKHTVTALYEIIPAGVKDDFVGSVDPLKYQQTEKQPVRNGSTDVMTVKFRYKEPDGDKSKLQQVVVNGRAADISNASEDMRFAASVAGYGMLLRNSAFKQNASFDEVIKLAKGAKGKDDNGYRAEFIRLAESTGDMMKTVAATIDR